MTEGPKNHSDSDEPVSTVEIIHRHDNVVSVKEKILVPIGLVVVGALLVGIGMVVRDHMHNDYRVLASPAAVMIAVQTPAPPAGTLSILINPDDSRFVAFGVRGWQYWGGKTGITADHYIRLPELRAQTLEALVKGDRGGAASLVFRLNLEESNPPQFRLDEVLRGGMASEEPPQNIEIHPLKTGERPVVGTTSRKGAYADGSEINYKRLETFSRLDRFSVMGRLTERDGALLVVGEKFRVVLAEQIDPGLRILLTDILNDQPHARLMVFLELEEIFPWSQDGKPGRRQAQQEIGIARLYGLELAKAFLVNPQKTVKAPA